MKNRGYITVEASMTIPLFLFFMVALMRMFMGLIVEAQIQQALCETAEYVAQYSYLENLNSSSETKDNIAVCFVNEVAANTMFHKYLEDSVYVRQVVANGKNGIFVSMQKDAENSKCFVLKANYKLVFSVPVLGVYSVAQSSMVRQKVFLGYSKEEGSQEDVYVYITPEQSVYHTKRGCTHLCLKVYAYNGTAMKKGRPCGFCGGEKYNQGKVYIAETGDVYHYSGTCGGLKRTVKRVRKKEVSGLRPCTRCTT